jgi:hypothetical protein
MAAPARGARKPVKDRLDSRVVRALLANQRLRRSERLRFVFRISERAVRIAPQTGMAPTRSTPCLAVAGLLRRRIDQRRCGGSPSSLRIWSSSTCRGAPSVWIRQRRSGRLGIPLEPSCRCVVEPSCLPEALTAPAGRRARQPEASSPRTQRWAAKQKSSTTRNARRGAQSRQTAGGPRGC